MSPIVKYIFFIFVVLSIFTIYCEVKEKNRKRSAKYSITSGTIAFGASCYWFAGPHGLQPILFIALILVAIHELWNMISGFLDKEQRAEIDLNLRFTIVECTLLYTLPTFYCAFRFALGHAIAHPR